MPESSVLPSFIPWGWRLRIGD
uniref:Uncharacterized protein n=1 Tax=Anguilla anguilla TaxID=7936 RepID=A0A0E9TFI3_ANGAN